MAINAPYTNGAVLASGGKLQVTDQQTVENLNASKLQGREPGNFLQIGNSFGTFGITQTTAGVIGTTGVTASHVGATENFDTTSVIKIGNVVIRSSNDGNGILVGIE